MEKKLFKARTAQLGFTNLAYLLLGIGALIIIAAAIYFVMKRFNFI